MCLGRQLLAQLPSTLISLGGHKNTVISCLPSILHRHPIPEPATLRVELFIPHHLFELEPHPEFTSKLKFCLKFYFGDENKQYVHLICGNIRKLCFFLRLSGQPTSFLSEKKKYSQQRAFYSTFPLVLNTSFTVT